MLYSVLLHLAQLIILAMLGENIRTTLSGDVIYGCLPYNEFSFVFHLEFYMFWMLDNDTACLDYMIVSLALSNWSGEGAFLFTSSSAPYDCDDGGVCDEVLVLH